MSTQGFMLNRSSSDMIENEVVLIIPNSRSFIPILRLTLSGMLADKPISLEELFELKLLLEESLNLVLSPTITSQLKPSRIAIGFKLSGKDKDTLIVTIRTLYEKQKLVVSPKEDVLLTTQLSEDEIRASEAIRIELITRLSDAFYIKCDDEGIRVSFTKKLSPLKEDKDIDARLNAREEKHT